MFLISKGKSSFELMFYEYILNRTYSNVSLSLINIIVKGYCRRRLLLFNTYTVLYEYCVSSGSMYKLSSNSFWNEVVASFETINERNFASSLAYSAIKFSKIFFAIEHLSPHDFSIKKLPNVNEMCSGPKKDNNINTNSDLIVRHATVQFITDWLPVESRFL